MPAGLRWVEVRFAVMLRSFVRADINSISKKTARGTAFKAANGFERKRANSFKACKPQANLQSGDRVSRTPGEHRRFRPQQSQALESQEQLAARPRVGGGVGDLRGRELARGPVRGLGAFGYAESEEYSGEVANAGLAEA